MKIKTTHLVWVLALLALSTLNPQLSTCLAQGTAFTYQGRLNSNGTPAGGTYDFRFRLAADPLGNTYVGSPYLTNGIAVSGGLFTTTMDFGPGLFAGSNYWLEVDVRTNGTVSYTGLTPLQALTPTPYAIFAGSSSNLLGALPAGQLSGTILNSSLPASPSFSGTVTAGALAGNGANVTNVNAASLNGLNATNFWQLGGNNVASNQFLGSMNNQVVEVRVNGQRAIRIEPPININAAPNIIEGSVHNSVEAGAGSATIGGGLYNTAGAGATVGGGDGNLANGFDSTIGGGYQNQATNQYATVGGGGINYALGFGATVAAGVQNIAGANYAFVGGGYGNVANGNGAVISGGGYDGGNFIGNVASGAASVIGGGLNNQATNSYATVPGGANNLAGGPYSFAAGQQAQAVHQGAFVWADSQNAPFISTAGNQFLIRAQGGVGINTAVTPDNYFSLNTNGYLFSHTLYLRGDSGSDHNHGLAYNGNTVTNFGTGNYQVDGPALWGFGGGLLGTRNGSDHAALIWNTTGVTVNGSIQVGTNGTAVALVQSGQATMPASSLQATNFTITFPHAFTAVPKVIVSIAFGIQGVSDIYAINVSSNSTTAFRVNVMRLDTAGGWGQNLLINWQAWQ